MVVSLWRLSPLFKMMLLCSNVITKALRTAALCGARGIAVGEPVLVAVGVSVSVGVSVGVMVGDWVSDTVNVLFALPK